MAGPGRCDIDTLTSRERKASKTVALPGVTFVPFRNGKPVVSRCRIIWRFMLRTPVAIFILILILILILSLATFQQA